MPARVDEVAGSGEMQPSPLPPQPIPPPRSRRRLILSIVTLVVVVVIEAVATLVWYPTTLQPKITMVDQQYSKSGCNDSTVGPYHWTYTWTFNLTNTGNANGFATVTYYEDSIWVTHGLYYVPAGYTFLKIESVDGLIHTGPPCAPNTPGIAITEVTKA